MDEFNLLIWILVLFIINEDPTSGDVTFEEESRKLKLSLSELPGEGIDLNNECHPKDTILDLLKRKLGFPVQKYTLQETGYDKQNLKKQSQKIQTRLLQSHSKQKENDLIENLKLIENLNLAEFDHLNKREKRVLDFDESDLDKDLIADHAKLIPIELRVSLQKHDNTGKYSGEKDKESQTEDLEIGQINRIGRTGRTGECKDGTASFAIKKCNLCRCIDSEWKCTDIKCITPEQEKWQWDDRYRALKGAPKVMYKKLRDQATGCMIGEKTYAAGTKDCPCTCVLPSVMVCDMCPAVRNIIIPQKQKTTTKSPANEPDYQYHYD